MAKAAPDKPTSAKGEIAVQSEGEASEDQGRSKLRWLMGWVVMPASVLGGIFGAGVLVGAHFSESWFVRSVLWIRDLF